MAVAPGTVALLEGVRMERWHELLRILKNGACTDGAVLSSEDAGTCVNAVERYIKQEEATMRDEIGRRDRVASDCAEVSSLKGYAGSGGIGMGVNATSAPGLNFGSAISWLRDGHRVARAVWPTTMFLALQSPDAHSKMNRPYIYVRLPDGRIEPVTLSHEDILAIDWRDAGPA